MTEEQTAKLNNLRMQALFALCGGNIQMFGLYMEQHNDKARVIGAGYDGLHKFQELAGREIVNALKTHTVFERSLAGLLGLDERNVLNFYMNEGNILLQIVTKYGELKSEFPNCPEFSDFIREVGQKLWLTGMLTVDGSGILAKVKSSAATRDVVKQWLPTPEPAAPTQPPSPEQPVQVGV